MVSRLAGGSTASGRPRGLVLVPTRELATQVTLVLKPLARAMNLWVTTIYGGVAYGPQVNALQRRTDIVVATPGRLADLIGQGECDLSDVEVTVIDEADQMADLGFLPIVRRLLETTPDGGQRMLFSATLDAAVDVLARRFLSDPVLHSVDENSSPAEIEHHVLTVDAANRVAVIAALAGGEKRSLVFTRTKHGAERLARQLTEAGIPAAELHGNLRQGARSRNLAAFTSGIARVMVATDIAARGIHVDGIDLVIHADPPAEHKAYVHRSGRTARARRGRRGRHAADQVPGPRRHRADAQGRHHAARGGRRGRGVGRAHRDRRAARAQGVGGGQGLRAGAAGGPAGRERPARRGPGPGTAGGRGLARAATGGPVRLRLARQGGRPARATGVAATVRPTATADGITGTATTAGGTGGTATTGDGTTGTGMTGPPVRTAGSVTNAPAGTAGRSAARVPRGRDPGRARSRPGRHSGRAPGAVAGPRRAGTLPDHPGVPDIPQAGDAAAKRRRPGQ